MFQRGGRKSGGPLTQPCDAQWVAKEPTDEETLQQIVERLQVKFPGVPRSEVERIARSEFEQYAGRPVRDYLTILVERSAKKKLRKGDRSAT